MAGPDIGDSLGIIQSVQPLYCQLNGVPITEIEDWNLVKGEPAKIRELKEKHAKLKKKLREIHMECAYQHQELMRMRNKRE